MIFQPNKWVGQLTPEQQERAKFMQLARNIRNISGGGDAEALAQQAIEAYNLIDNYRQRGDLGGAWDQQTRAFTLLQQAAQMGMVISDDTSRVPSQPPAQPATSQPTPSSQQDKAGQNIDPVYSEIASPDQQRSVVTPSSLPPKFAEIRVRTPSKSDYESWLDDCKREYALYQKICKEKIDYLTNLLLVYEMPRIRAKVDEIPQQIQTEIKRYLNTLSQYLDSIEKTIIEESRTPQPKSLSVLYPFYYDTPNIPVITQPITPTPNIFVPTTMQTRVRVRDGSPRQTASMVVRPPKAPTQSLTPITT